MNSSDVVNLFLEIRRKILEINKPKRGDYIRIAKKITDMLLENTSLGKGQRIKRLLEERLKIEEFDYHINLVLYYFSKDLKGVTIPPQGEVKMSNVSFLNFLIANIETSLEDVLPSPIQKLFYLFYKAFNRYKIEEIKVYRLKSKEPGLFFYALAHEIAHVILYYNAKGTVPEKIEEMLTVAISSVIPKLTLTYYKITEDVIRRYKEFNPESKIILDNPSYRALGIAISELLPRKSLGNIVKKWEYFVKELEPWKFSVIYRDLKFWEIYKRALEWIEDKVKFERY